MPFPCPRSSDEIVAAQNPDGGWGYRGGGSWTEPTAYALLAMAATGADAASSARGVKWLLANRRPDGGWPPRPSVEQSTWVTALVLLLLGSRKNSAEAEGAARWLLQQTGRESSFFYRLRLVLLGVKDGVDTGVTGWPWYPETAAWVAPTALTVLALEKAERRYPSKELRERIVMGRKFLLSRRCADGGWNHGSSRALGYESGSYPETTGLALLALHGVPAEQLGKSLETAGRHLQSCRSAEGIAWLRLGLLSHARHESSGRVEETRCRNLLDVCLGALAGAAAEGRNVFWG